MGLSAQNPELSEKQAINLLVSAPGSEYKTKSFTDSDQQVKLDKESIVLYLSATNDCYVRFDGVAAANSGNERGMFIPYGQVIPVPIRTSTVNVIRDTTNGELHITNLWNRMS